MRILCVALVAFGCGSPAAPTTTPEPIENEQPREIVDEAPPTAVVVIIDRSGSMQGEKLESAKGGALELAQSLPVDALFGVIAFDSEPTTIVRLQAAGNERIGGDLDQLTAGGGTNIFPALRDSFELLATIQAERKLVLLVSDGEAPYDGVVDLVNEMTANGIRTSSIGLPGADRELLSQIAEAGGGSLFMVEDTTALGRVIQKAITD